MSTFSPEQQSQLEAGLALQRIEFEPWSQAAAGVSALVSFAILATGLYWYKEMAATKIYMKLIMMISLCDFVACTFMSLGYPRSDALCRVQGGMNYFFFRASWFWVASLTMATFFHLNNGRMPRYLKFRHLNALIWGSSLLLELLPLSWGVGYGGCDHGANWGSLRFRPDTLPLTIENTAAALFTVPLLVSLTVCVTLPLYLWCITLPMWAKGHRAAYERVRAMVSHVFFYPALLLVFWGPNVLYGVIAPKLAVPTVEDRLNISRNFKYTGVWCYMFGTSCSLLFIAKSAETRARWFAAVSRLCPRLAACIPGQAAAAAADGTNDRGSVAGPGADPAAEDFLRDEDYEAEYDTRGLDDGAMGRGRRGGGGGEEDGEGDGSARERGRGPTRNPIAASPRETGAAAGVKAKNSASAAASGLDIL